MTDKARDLKIKGCKEKYNLLLIKFSEEVMDVDKHLIADGEFIKELFNLNVMYQPENLMNFMKKTGTQYFDERRCEEAGMFVE